MTAADERAAVVAWIRDAAQSWAAVDAAARERAVAAGREPLPPSPVPEALAVAASLIEQGQHHKPPLRPGSPGYAGPA